MSAVARACFLTVALLLLAAACGANPRPAVVDVAEAPVSAAPVSAAEPVSAATPAATTPVANPDTDAAGVDAEPPPWTADPARGEVEPAPAEVVVFEASDDAPPTVAGGVFAAPWSAEVVTRVNSDGTWTLEASGVPDHEIDHLVAVRSDDGNGRGSVIENPTERQDFVVRLPLEPRLAEEITTVRRGPVGVLVSGAALFGPAIRDGEPVVARNFEVGGAYFLDACNGHAGERGTYHYHGVPYCITDAVDRGGTHSTMIGVALDGFPVYGPRDVDGASPIGLDECSGHVGPTPEFPQGTYHYHLTEQAPYGVGCLRGAVQPLDRAGTRAEPSAPAEPAEPSEPAAASEDHEGSDGEPVERPARPDRERDALRAPAPDRERVDDRERERVDRADRDRPGRPRGDAG